MNRLLARLLSEPLSGIFHAGGPRRLTLYQIAQIVNLVGGYEPELLTGCPRLDAGPIPPRAGNVTLDTAKLAAWFDVTPDSIKRFDIADLNVIKISMPRPVIQGHITDRDMHGAAWAAHLAEMYL